MMPISDPIERRLYQIVWLQDRRNAWIKENGPCNRCGTWKNLEVDHIDPSIKECPVSSIWSLSPHNPKRIMELAKCQVLCEECHVTKTNEDQGNNNYVHGTQIMYHRGRCRCSSCKEAMKLYFREYRKRRKEKEKTKQSPVD